VKLFHTFCGTLLSVVKGVIALLHKFMEMLVLIKSNIIANFLLEHHGSYPSRGPQLSIPGLDTDSVPK
jgi:hypothetical protein